MSKIRELDGLRGVLAVWVVGAHLLPSAGIDAARFGWFAPLFGEHMRVQIFCILSGFVIFLMFDKRRSGWADFVRGRFWRLYPVYILAFGLSVLMVPVTVAALQSAPFSGLRMEARLAIMDSALAQPLEHVLVHVTLLHGVVLHSLLLHAAYAFLGQGWNISTEFQFYLLAPLLFAGLVTGPLWRRALAAAACLGLWAALRQWPNPADLAQYAPWFALGIISHALWRRSWPGLSGWAVAGSALAVFGAVSMAAGIWILLLGGLLIRRDQGRGDLCLAWLRWPVMQWLGQISYSLYLLHMIPLYLGMYVINGLGLDRPSYLLALSGFTFALALPLSWLVTQQVERRFMRRAAPVLPEGGAVSVPGHGPTPAGELRV